jgi:hypothetical protein
MEIKETIRNSIIIVQLCNFSSVFHFPVYANNVESLYT